MKNPFILKGSLQSAINGARAGHKNDAQRLAGGIAELLRNDEPLPQAAKAYLIEALDAIAIGEPGNTAFNTAGRRGVRDRQQFITPARIAAHYMQALLDSGEAESANEASQLAEEQLGCPDESNIRKAHRELFPSK
jgi:hypothetical protein